MFSVLSTKTKAKSVLSQKSGMKKDDFPDEMLFSETEYGIAIQLSLEQPPGVRGASPRTVENPRIT